MANGRRGCAVAGRRAGGTVESDELYQKLKPFEQRVAEDIETGRHSRETS